VVRTHPKTGRRALFVNGNSTTHILGLSPRENDALLPFLIDHVRSPEFQCRFRWQRNSVAFWDNRSTQHFAVPDYGERRVMNRVTVGGDKPV
jgi:taurine dioxygenase